MMHDVMGGGMMWGMKPPGLPWSSCPFWAPRLWSNIYSFDDLGRLTRTKLGPHDAPRRIFESHGVLVLEVLEDSSLPNSMRAKRVGGAYVNR